MKNDGFGIVGIILSIVVIAVIGTSGYFVIKHRDTKTTTPTVSTSVQKPPKKKPNTTSPTPQQQYLDITQWGVKLPLSTAINGAYYAVPTGGSNDADGLPSALSLGVTSLNSSCGVVSSSSQGFDNSLGALVRVPPTASDPTSGELYTQLDPGGVTIGSYYYGYADANIIGKTCASSTTLNNISSAFKVAAGGIVEAN
jgi:hypothetical protein